MEAIHRFLSDRKDAWLKEKLKGKTEEEKANLEQQANEKYALATWLPDAAKRAKQITLSSHPSKFSHPDAIRFSVIAQNAPACDGYLRSGNVAYDLDAYGNAAALDVYTFLCLTMNDGKTVLEHLEQDTPAIQAVMHIPTSSYAELKQGFLCMKQADGAIKTDHLIKQVYFPVAEGYHLLSLLTPSGLLVQLKQRADKLRFSENAKLARDSRKNNRYHEQGYEDLPNLTITSFGGTKPQNISRLNSQNAGKAYLLASVPPTLRQRNIRLPDKDFFAQTLYAKTFTDEFEALDKLVRIDINNIKIRDAIRDRLRSIVEQVLDYVAAVRALGVAVNISGVSWSQTEHYQSLPLAQRIWLDDDHLPEREQQDQWLNEVATDCARWILNTYEELHKKLLSDAELLHVKGLVEETIHEDKEFFK